MANDGKRFIKGSGIAKHREWRGLKDTFYDYTQWVVNLGLLVQFVAKSPAVPELAPAEVKAPEEPAAAPEAPVPAIRTNGRTVLISGGDRGIGAATAKAFYEAGYRVAVFYHKNSVSDTFEFSHDFGKPLGSGIIQICRWLIENIDFWGKRIHRTDCNLLLFTTG